MLYRAICPGFEQRQSDDTTLADRGTLQHKAVETRDLSILPEEEMKAAALKCIQVLETLEEGADQILREEILEICGGRTFGSADEIIIKGREALLVDFKFGRLPVPAVATNLQIWSYVLGVFDRWPKLKTVTAWILAPYQDVVDKHTFHRSDRPAMKEKILGILARAELYAQTRDPKMLRKSTDACQYCSHLGVCEATAPLAVEAVAKYEPLEALTDAHSSGITCQSRMARALAYAPILEKMAESIRFHAKQLAEQEGGLRDENGDLLYELVTKNSPRSLDKSKVADAVEALREAGLSDGEILSVSDISIPRAVDLVVDKAVGKRGIKKSTRGAIETKLYDLEVYLTGGTTTSLRKVKKKSVDDAIDV